MTPLASLLKETDARMEKTLEHMQHEFAGIRTGKASPALVENITVDYYGTPTRLKELAGISAPEPRMIVVHPWDASAVPAVVKAISGANVGINPVPDGKIIRIPIPELDEERRKELTRLIKKMGEDSKIAIRNIRRETNDNIKKMQKNSEISEDDMYREEDLVQKATDNHIKEIDKIVAGKEKEIMEV